MDNNIDNKNVIFTGDVIQPESGPIFKDLDWYDETKWKSYADIHLPGSNKNDRYMVYENKEDNYIIILLGSVWAEDAESIEDGKRIAQEHFQKRMTEIYNEIQSLIK